MQNIFTLVLLALFAIVTLQYDHERRAGGKGGKRNWGKNINRGLGGLNNALGLAGAITTAARGGHYHEKRGGRNWGKNINRGLGGANNALGLAGAIATAARGGQ